MIQKLADLILQGTGCDPMVAAQTAETLVKEGWTQVDKPCGVILVCAGGCGKTTDDVNPREFWKGKVEPPPVGLVPKWTCFECKGKEKKTCTERSRSIGDVLIGTANKIKKEY